jgi:hypothetical protein
MRIAVVLFIPLLSAASVSGQTWSGASPIFTHDALTCMTTADFPVVEAELEPAELRALRQAQVYFKASSTEAWYFVDMEPGEGSRLRATLPKPLAETDRVDYYLFFLSSSFEPAQSNQFSARVTDAGCGDIRRVVPGSPVSLVLRGTISNQASVPVGFNVEGISSFVTAAGDTVTVGSVAAAGGGAASSGLSGAAIGAIAGGGAAAAAAAVVIGGSGTDGDTSAASSNLGSTGPGGNTPASSATGSPPAPTENPTPTPIPTPSIPDVSGTWQITDRIIESCFPGTVGQTSNTTMMIQQNGTQLTVTLSGVNFSGNMTGTIDAAGTISMRGQFNDEGDVGEVRVEATTTSGSDMTGTYTQFYPDHNCTVRGTFSGSKR